MCGGEKGGKDYMPTKQLENDICLWTKQKYSNILCPKGDLRWWTFIEPWSKHFSIQDHSCTWHVLKVRISQHHSDFVWPMAAGLLFSSGLKHLHNCLMVCCEIEYKHSWSPEDKMYLLWFPDFSSSAIICSNSWFVQYFGSWQYTCKTSLIPFVFTAN